MGVQPKTTILSNQCPLCYPVNESPVELIAFFAGIVRSQSYPPSPHPTPNGSVRLEETGIPGGWFGTNAFAWECTFTLNVGVSTLVLKTWDPAFAFSASPADQCRFHFSNVFQNPITNSYNFGHAIVLTPAQIVELVETHMPVDPDSARFEIYPGPDELVSIRHADLQHRFNVLLHFHVDDFWP